MTTSSFSGSVVHGLAEPDSAHFVEWAVRTRGRRGARVTGDHGMVMRVGGGVLVAGVDGLGHGPAAAIAAREAVAVLRRNAERTGGDLAALMVECHTGLRDTRGASVSLAFLSSGIDTMIWLGVGDVEGRVVRSGHAGSDGGISLLLLPGLVGHELPRLRTTTAAVLRGDLVAFATDGVRADFADRLDTVGSPAAIAERVLSEQWNGEDDALVIVLRWLGRPPVAAS